jgi:type II secretory pathway component PulJ
MRRVNRTNRLIIVMVALLLLLVLGAAVLCTSYVRTLTYAQLLQAESQRLQTQLAMANRTRNIIRAMAEDALEYSKRNPAIDPILQQFDVKPKPAAPAAKTPSR